MASIERTAYPRFTASLSMQELQTLYAPTDEERDFVTTHAQTGMQQLTLLTLLKGIVNLLPVDAFFGQEGGGSPSVSLPTLPLAL
jgi:hypothetical protein